MKTDAKKLTSQAQQEKRNLAVKLRDRGTQNNEVAQLLDVHPGTVSGWYSRYKETRKKSSSRKEAEEKARVKNSQMNKSSRSFVNS